MTCPFYICDGRPECILGDDRAERHCGPRTYPAHACNLDEIGEWGAWRAVGREVSWRAEVISEMAQEYDTDRLDLGALFVSLAMYIEIRISLEAVGWSP